MASDGHRRNRHVQSLDRLDGGRRGRTGIAVADHDHVLDGGVLQRLESPMGQDHGRIELRHVSGRHHADSSHHDLAIRSHHGQARVPEPLGCRAVVVVNHAAVVARAQRLHGLFGDPLLPEIALRHLGGVHHHDQGAPGNHLGGLDLEIDGHGFFQVRVRPAAGAETVGGSHHHQPAAQLLRVSHEHLDLVVGESFPRHVSQNNRIVLLQLGKVREGQFAATHVDFNIPPAQSLHQSLVLAESRAVLDEQDLSLAPNVAEGGGLVVLPHGVVFRTVRNELRRVAVEADIVDLLANGKDLLARSEVDLVLADHVVVAPNHERSANGPVPFGRWLRQIAQHDPEVEGMPLANVARNGHSLQKHLALAVVANGHNIDSDAGFRHVPGLFEGDAQVLVAVADDDDSLGGVFRKRRLGEAYRRCQVRGPLVEFAFEQLGQLHVVVERRNLDRGVSPEHDHSCAIVVFTVLANLVVHVLHHRLTLLDRNAQ